MSYIRWFSEVGRADVRSVGGKGASLGELTRIGIPVPPGFIVTTHAFEECLAASGLSSAICTELERVAVDNVASIDRASERIRRWILDADVSNMLCAELEVACAQLASPLVAVRSSATAEDASDASWAGELESYLNTPQHELLTNIKRCWASLFTARAITYRIEKGLRETPVSVAVVMQMMVASEASGVTFTVHPVTKDSNTLIIEACFGLGELLVSGMVTPDTYTVQKRSPSSLHKEISEQDEMMVRGASGNTMVPVPIERRSDQKLSDEHILALTDICKTIEVHYGFPCDIEWAVSQGNIFIVQSRPITTL